MVPVKYHVQKELMPDKPTRLQLENAARESDVFSHIAVMPDVHSKFGRKCPTGTVMATKSMIFPQVMDTAPNCGMRLLATPWGEDDLRDELIDEMFLELIKAVPTHTYFGNYIDFKTTIDICRRGSAAVLEYLGKSKEELQMIYKGGNFFDEPPGKKEIFDSVPKIFIRAAQFRLGILGEAGNHFLDLMKIEKVLDEEKARILGLKKGQYVFLMHTGSGILGQYISYFFTPKREEHLSMKIITKLGRLTFDSDLLSGAGIKKLRNQVKKYREKTEFFKIDPQSKTGRAYWTAHRAGANYGFANRTMITQNVKGALKKYLIKK
ncbi:RtcB family protein [Patescibacteria group bacterium]|nr:RtcB family protein [Patescibacteria group bacterium]